jgi:hypothetical protein
MNYDTVLPDRILRRYRRPRFQWVKRSLAIGAILLGFLAFKCSTWLLSPHQPNPLVREISQRALARVSTTAPPALRATLVKLPDDNWNNVCTP